MNSLRPDHVIINAVLGGDTAQYNDLVVRHKNYAYTIALKIVRNTMDAEEIAHDAFVKAFKSLKSFNQKAKFSTWLYRIVFNTAISHTRKNHLNTEDLSEINEQPMSTSNTSSLVDSTDREKYVAEAMLKLLPLDSSLISLFYMQQLSLEEIGEVVGLKPDAVKVKLFRARKRLGRELVALLQNEVHEIL